MNLKINIHKIKHIKDAEFTMRLTRVWGRASMPLT